MQFIWTSLILSVVLTALINIVPRFFPGATDRAERAVRSRAEQWGDEDQPRVRVWFPWRTMLIASIALTVVGNLVAALT